MKTHIFLDLSWIVNPAQHKICTFDTKHPVFRLALRFLLCKMAAFSFGNFSLVFLYVHVINDRLVFANLISFLSLGIDTQVYVYFPRIAHVFPNMCTASPQKIFPLIIMKTGNNFFVTISPD